MNHHFSMLIQWSEEDQLYVVTLPEFSGSHTHGQTYKEAVKNGQQVLDLLVETYQTEGRPLPQPKTFDSSVPVA